MLPVDLDEDTRSDCGSSVCHSCHSEDDCEQAPMSCEEQQSPTTALAPEECLPCTLYAVLGVSITASSDVIRSAYRKLARLWHPDRHRGDEQAKRKFQELQGAYEVLSDLSRRYEYDLNLLEFLDVEDYLSRYKGLILTASGLCMNSRHNSSGHRGSCGHTTEPMLRPRAWQLLKAA